MNLQLAVMRHKIVSLLPGLTLLCIMQPRTAKKAVLFVGEYDKDSERYLPCLCYPSHTQVTPENMPAPLQLHIQGPVLC